jgi:hypothetical protein
MRCRIEFCYFLIIALVMPKIVCGWGYDAHQRINWSAATIIPGTFGKYVRSNRQELAQYAVVADYLKSSDSKESPRHYIDADLYDDFPFDSLSGSLVDLESKYGRDVVEKWGYVPWAIDEACSRVIYMLKNKRWNEGVFHMSTIGHYISDIHVPNHAVENYNGQLTGNDGIHFRWESRMVDEHVKSIRPTGPLPLVSGSVVDFSMNIVRESYVTMQQILNADTKARKLLSSSEQQQLNSYDILSFEGPYLQSLYDQTADLVQDRIEMAVLRIAAMWVYCWNEAGQPPPPKR